MASAASLTFTPLPVRAIKRTASKNATTAKAVRAVRVVRPVAIAQQQPQKIVERLSIAAATAAIPLIPAADAYAAQEAMGQVALQGANILGLIATALFVLVPTSFLVTLYFASDAADNVSGGYGANSQGYYDKSKKLGNKKGNAAVEMKGKGVGMYADE